MSLSKERIVYLLEVYTSRKATADEEQELMEWIRHADEDSELKTFVQTLWMERSAAAEPARVNWNRMFENILQNDKVHSIAPKPRRVFWPRIAAAASVLLVLLSGAYLLFQSSKRDQSPFAAKVQAPAYDVAPPSSNKATLTLGNRTVIFLDSAGTGSLGLQGAASVHKVNEGELVYRNDASVVEYHTLTVPKGSMPMQLQLADGSDVWLNAASSITFPTVFPGNDREVSITGEVYFEVAKNAAKKFMVTARETTTEVFGTHFNINAYGNEPNVKVTLLEGSVAVNGSRIKPGQQALATQGAVQVMDNVSTEEVMAWKNGMFEFNNTDIQSIMHQIERWYDVEVIFDGNFTQHFSGTIPRQVNVSSVLRMLEKTGGVRFSVEGNRVLVKKY